MLLGWLGAAPTTLTHGHVYRQRLVFTEPCQAEPRPGEPLVNLTLPRELKASMEANDWADVTVLVGNIPSMSDQHAATAFMTVWDKKRNTITQAVVPIGGTEEEFRGCFAWIEARWIGNDNTPLSPVIQPGAIPVDFWDATTGEVFFEPPPDVPLPPAPSTPQPPSVVPPTLPIKKASAAPIVIGVALVGALLYWAS